MKSTTFATLVVLALIGATYIATPVAAQSSSYLIPLGKADTNKDGMLDGDEAEAYCNGHEAECDVFWARLSEGNTEAYDYARASGLAALVNESETVRLADVSSNDQWDVSGPKGWYTERKLGGQTEVYNHPVYGVWARRNCTNVLRGSGRPAPAPQPAPEPAPEPEPVPAPAPAEEPMVLGVVLHEHYGTVTHVGGSQPCNGCNHAPAPAPRPRANCPEAYRAFAQMGPGYSERWGVQINSADDLAELWAEKEPGRCYAQPAPPPRQVCQAPSPRRGGGFGLQLGPIVFGGRGHRPPPPRHFVPPRPPQNRVVFVQGPPTNVVQNNNQNQNTNVNVQ